MLVFKFQYVVCKNMSAIGTASIFWKIKLEIKYIHLYINETEINSMIEFHFSGLIGMASHLDMQIIQIIGFFLEIRLHWQFEIRLLLFTVCTCV